MSYIKCQWSCVKCDLGGNVRLWAYPGDTPQETAARETERTRQCCVKGCTYVVVDGGKRKRSTAGQPGKSKSSVSVSVAFPGHQGDPRAMTTKDDHAR